MGRDKKHRGGTLRVGRGGVFFLHQLENKSLTRKQAKKTKTADISREQHSKQANIRQGKLRKVTQKVKVCRPGFHNSRYILFACLIALFAQL